MSHATVTTTSAFTPASATMEMRGGPSDLPIPPIVRRYCEALKTSAASTIACSCSDRRRRIGSLPAGPPAPRLPLLGQAPQDRLARDGLLDRLRAVPEQIREQPAPTPPPLGRNGRRGRRALAHPAVLDRRLGAERTDVDIVAAAVRREPRGPLTHQQGALADGARAVHGAPCDTCHDPSRVPRKHPVQRPLVMWNSLISLLVQLQPRQRAAQNDCEPAVEVGVRLLRQVVALARPRYSVREPGDGHRQLERLRESLAPRLEVGVPKPREPRVVRRQAGHLLE